MQTSEDGTATITIDRTLMRALRARADLTGVEAGDLVELAIRNCLAELEPGAPRVRRFAPPARERDVFFDWSR